MSVLAEPVTANQPLTRSDVQTSSGDVPDTKYTDEATLRIVLDDFSTAQAWLADANWSLQWRESKILYQSPRGLATFEGTTVTRANVSRFTVAKQVNSLAPSISGPIFSDPTYLQVQPRGRTTQEAADAWRDLLLTLLDDCDFKQELCYGIEGMTNQGTVIFKGGFETTETIEKHYVRKQAPPTAPLPLGDPMPVFTKESDEFECVEKPVKRSRPFFEKCELGTVFIDPKWNKPNQLWKARFLIHKDYVTYDDLKLLAQNPDYDIPDEETLRAMIFGDEEQTESLSATEQQMTETGNGAIAHAERRDANTSEDPTLKVFELLEHWTNERCRVVLQGKVVIRNNRHEMPTKPFWSANFWNMEDTGYGMGVGRIAGSDQRVDQGTINAALDIISMAVNPDYLVSNDANAGTQNIRQRLGGITLVDGDVNAAFKLKEQPKVPADVWTVTQLSREASESATGADQATVQGSMPGGKSSFGRSGTGAGILGKASSARIQAPVDRVIDGVVLPFAEFLFDMVREHMTMTEIREILSDTPAGALLTDMYDFMNAKMKLDTLAGVRLAARQAMAASLPFLLQVFENPQLIQQMNQTGFKVDVNELIDMVVEISEWKNKRQLIVPMTPQETQQMQAMAGAAPNKLRDAQTLLAQKGQQDQQLEDQKAHARVVVQTLKQTGDQVTQSPLDRAANFSTRDQLEQQMKQSPYFSGGQGL